MLIYTSLHAGAWIGYSGVWYSYSYCNPSLNGKGIQNRLVKVHYSESESPLFCFPRITPLVFYSWTGQLHYLLIVDVRAKRDPPWLGRSHLKNVRSWDSPNWYFSFVFQQFLQSICQDKGILPQPPKIGAEKVCSLCFTYINNKIDYKMLNLLKDT